jgi:hypothetical protein
MQINGPSMKSGNDANGNPWEYRKYQIQGFWGGDRYSTATCDDEYPGDDGLDDHGNPREHEFSGGGGCESIGFVWAWSATEAIDIALQDPSMQQSVMRYLEALEDPESDSELVAEPDSEKFIESSFDDGSPNY